MQSPMIFLRLKAVLLLAMLLLSSCATISKPKEVLVPGQEIETIQSSVSVTVKTSNRSVGGRGYLVFRHPDQFHLAILSPFGFTLIDIYSDGEELICLLPSKNLAYRGLLSELPEQGGLGSWGLIEWVVARPPVSGPSLGVREIVMTDGRHEQIFFDSNGLIIRKLTADGDEAIYEGYRAVNGVAFPESIEMGNRYGDRVKITFDDPEVNEPVEDAALKPRLENVTVLPLRDFKGF